MGLQLPMPFSYKLTKHLSELKLQKHDQNQHISTAVSYVTWFCRKLKLQNQVMILKNDFEE